MEKSLSLILLILLGTTLVYLLIAKVIIPIIKIYRQNARIK